MVRKWPLMVDALDFAAYPDLTQAIVMIMVIGAYYE